MRRLRKKQSDSLDLLLDTICNAFGGIVLITILITLLARDREREVDVRESPMDRELVERQIASLKSEIEAAQSYLSRQALNVSVDPLLMARLHRSQASLQTAKDKNEESWRVWNTTAAEVSGKDPEVDRAMGEQVRISSRLARFATEEEALRQKLERLGDRLEALYGERQDAITAKSESLRLPRESLREMSAVHFILKYDEVFSLYRAEGRQRVKNRAIFDWKESRESFTVQPSKGKGWSPGSASTGISEIIDLAKREDSYAAIFLYSDSVPSYRALKKLLERAGLRFGLDVETETGVSFGPDGSNPPPL